MNEDWWGKLGPRRQDESQKQKRALRDLDAA